MRHGLVIHPDIGMLVLDMLVDEGQRVLTAMELNAAFQITGQSGQTVYPSVESRFKLRP